ncbi:hypothetical protein ccbrp13_60090 [Ktedonobacteria bacterium brp13]|nr:hypothetical protein ccbrp13_60090 [Ktedonobacteria bacterium brp13]
MLEPEPRDQHDKNAIDARKHGRFRNTCVCHGTCEAQQCDTHATAKSPSPEDGSPTGHP